MVTTILAGIFGGIALTSSIWVYDTKTSGGECERISNLINKTHVIDVCSQQNDFAACVDLYDKRL